MGQAILVGSSLTSCIGLDGEGWGEFRELDLPACIKTSHLRKILQKREREIHMVADGTGTTGLLPFFTGFVVQITTPTRTTNDGKREVATTNYLSPSVSQ